MHRWGSVVFSDTILELMCTVSRLDDPPPTSHVPWMVLSDAVGNPPGRIETSRPTGGHSRNSPTEKDMIQVNADPRTIGKVLYTVGYHGNLRQRECQGESGRVERSQQDLPHTTKRRAPGVFPITVRFCFSVAKMYNRTMAKKVPIDPLGDRR